MAPDPQESRVSERGPRRLLVRTGIGVLLLVGVTYAWTFTPSYSLFRIKYALESHDYPTFARYVDVDSVIDHALDDLAQGEVEERNDKTLPEVLGGLFGSKVLRELARGARPLIAIAVEQAVKDQDRPLPQIPFFAVVGALWYGSTEEDRVSFPIKLKKGKRIAVKASQTSAGLWRVDEVDDIRTLLSTIEARHFSESGSGF